MKNTGWIAIALAAGSVLAQQPRVENARVETRTVSGGLDATLRAILSGQTAPAWIGYAEPMIPGDRQMCCRNDDQRGCFLEPHTGSPAVSASANQTVKLEGPTHLVVLYRIENHQVEKIRSFTPECTLDVGGLPFIWITGATPADSVRYLLNVAQSQRSSGSVSAIALHADASADQALEQLAGPAESDQVRRQAIFWLGSARGKRGFELVSRILREDPNDKIREHAIFALTQSQEPEAMNAVVRAAHDDTSPRVRGQALFWLAQKAAQKTAQAAISDAIANDPQTEVKKRAVFALTQMPAGEGVPLLIQVARSNQNAAVRKQAMFWLGQSKDPRALAYIEEVLK